MGFLVTRVSESYSYSSFLNQLIVHWVYTLLSTLICILCFWVFEQCLALVGNAAGIYIFLRSQLWPYKNGAVFASAGPREGLLYIGVEINPSPKGKKGLLAAQVN